MRELNPKYPRFSWFLPGLMAAAFSYAWATPSEATDVRKPLGNDDDTFIFMGRCPHGEVYRLLSYDKEVNGLKQSFYDYEGPAGKGTVKTKTEPRVMMSRVCLALAEIAGDE